MVNNNRSVFLVLIYFKYYKSFILKMKNMKEK